MSSLEFPGRQVYEAVCAKECYTVAANVTAWEGCGCPLRPVCMYSGSRNAARRLPRLVSAVHHKTSAGRHCNVIHCRRRRRRSLSEPTEPCSGIQRLRRAQQGDASARPCLWRDRGAAPGSRGSGQPLPQPHGPRGFRAPHKSPHGEDFSGAAAAAAAAIPTD